MGALSAPTAPLTPARFPRPSPQLLRQLLSLPEGHGPFPVTAPIQRSALGVIPL